MLQFSQPVHIHLKNEQKATGEIFSPATKDKKAEIDAIDALEKDAKDEVFIELTPANKGWILNQMGFIHKGSSMWYHPAFGGDTLNNYLTFDLHLEAVSTIILRVIDLARYQNREYLIRKILEK